MGLLQVVVYAAASKVDTQSNAEETAPPSEAPPANETTNDTQKDPHISGIESNPLGESTSAQNSKSDGQKSIRTYDIFLLMPQSDLSNLCGLLGHEGYFSIFFIYF